MLYTLVIVLCLAGECESFVWRDLMPAWECMDEAYEISSIGGEGWHVQRASCIRMFKTGGIGI